MLTVTPLQCILDMITTSKFVCALHKRKPVSHTAKLDQLFHAQNDLRQICELIAEYDREIAMSVSSVDTVMNIPPPDGYMYVAITPLEQLRMSLKRCSCLLHQLAIKETRDEIDMLWCSCLQGIIAYKSSWYKLFDILEDSQPSLQKIIAVFSRVRECLSVTHDYIEKLYLLHEELYFRTVVSKLQLPDEIQMDVQNYLQRKIKK